MSLGDILDGGANLVKGFLSNPFGPGMFLPKEVTNPNALQDFTNNPVQFATSMATPRLAGDVVGAVADKPVVKQVFQALDLARRGIDTALITANHAGSVQDRQGGNAWAELLNTDSWSRAWDQSSYDNVGRVTGGQVLVNSFTGDKTLDPLDPTGAKELQANATATWYGRSMTTAIDLGESFIAPPGLGTLARGRAAAGFRTIEQVDAAAQRYAEVGVQGRSLYKRAGDTARQYMVPNGSQNVDAQIRRVSEGLKEFDGLRDESVVFDRLKTRLQTAPDGEIANLANVFTEINKLDPAVREDLRMNAWLANLGSETAKAALVEKAPLLAANLRGLTTVPREWGALDDLYSLRLTHDGDIPINDIVERAWGTKADRGELDALKSLAWEKKGLYDQHRQLVADLKDLKPKVQGSPEGLHIKAKREELAAEVTKLQAELKTAKRDLHGTRRWAAGQAKATTKSAAGTDLTSGVGRADFQSGPLAQHADLNQAIGDARRRVSDLEDQLKAAKNDRALLEQTPVNDPQALADWRATVAEARGLRAGTKAELDSVLADAKGLRDQIKAKQREIAQATSRLNRADDLINDVLDIASPARAHAGDAKPTMLGQLKQHIRDQIGGETYVTAGQGNRILRVRSLPGRAARMALAPQARGQIALREVGLGARQLSDTMGRSGVFTPEQIIEAKNLLIRTPEAERVQVVQRINEQMIERLAHDFYRKKTPDITPEEAARHAKEVAALTNKAWGQGNDWVIRHADEQITNDVVTIPDLDGPPVAYDAATLRSQLADSTPILDPWDVNRMLREHETSLVNKARGYFSDAMQLHDYVVGVWKVAALLRPGLMTRSMLDTYPRAMASMSAFEHGVAAMNGAANFMHNRALSGMAKIEFRGLTPDVAAAKMNYFGIKPIKAGGKEWQFARDVDQQMREQMAMTKGSTVHNVFFKDFAKSYDGMRLDRGSWKRVDADSKLWHVGYQQYAHQLIASPTARRVAELLTKEADGAVDMAKLFRQLKGSREFMDEYRVLGRDIGLSRSQWLQQVVHEVSAVFPDAQTLNAVKNGGLSRKFVEKKFPRTERFDVPAPEMSALGANAAMTHMKGALDAAFRVLLDKPDMWLARNPVAVTVFRRNVRREVDALLKKHGPDYELTPNQYLAIEAKARSQAIGYVRNTFFDTTRYTGLHRATARFSPFIAAWEDAMISWGRLIYDDPRRLVKLSAAYHSPYTVAASNPDWSVVVDNNGQPIARDSNADGVYVNIPPAVVKAVVGAAKPVLDKLGLETDTTNVGAYRMRLDAINSIAQGETFWLPGVGPTVQVGAAWALGSDKIISKEAALDLVSTDNALGKAVLKSVFLGGEVPPSDPGSLAASTVPGWLRAFATETLGNGKTRTRQTNFNYLVAEAMANGEELSPDRYNELWAKADKSANAAAVIRLAMGGGLGFTGTGTVDGQFYADQMHIIQGMPPELRVDKNTGQRLSVEEFFAQEYPEAADLDWSITKNKTGITANVTAAKAEGRLSGVLKKNPQDIGWMVLGADNAAPEEFSRTAYSMQRSDGSRVYQTTEEAQSEAQASVGFRQYNGYQQQVEDALVAAGADPNTVRQSKQFLAVKKAIRQHLEAENPAFAKRMGEYSNNFNYYYQQALRLSAEGPLTGRPDMQAFRDYDMARQQVMTMFGIESFGGTTEKYVRAKAVMKALGTKLSADNLGFEQMWNRFLEREVE